MVRGHICDAPVRVTVDQDDGEPVALPIVDNGVEVHHRKDGPLDVSRRAEVDFALTSNTVDWYSYVDAYEEGGGMQQATVYMKALGRDGSYGDNLVPVLRGYIGGVGSSGDNVGHLTIFGPFKLLQHIAISHTIAPKSHALEFPHLITKTLNERQDIIDDVEFWSPALPAWKSRRDLQTDTSFRRGGKQLTYNVDHTSPTSDEEEQYGRNVYFVDEYTRFNRDEHTLADVAKTFTDDFDLRLYFRTLQDGRNVLHVERSPGLMWDTTGDNTEAPAPIHNNAIFEMKPFNAILVKGSRSDNKIPEAIAWYPALTERAGGKIAKVKRTSAPNADRAEAQARSELKKALDGITGGTINFTLTPNMFPFDAVKAQPSCAGIVSTDLPPIDYEVERASHTIDPKDLSTNELPQTEVAVSMYIDSSSIESKAAMVTDRPAEDSPNVPSDELDVENFKWGI